MLENKARGKGSRADSKREVHVYLVRFEAHFFVHYKCTPLRAVYLVDVFQERSEQGKYFAVIAHGRQI